ncbi:CHAT domain-containing tetratricopeptide repeat protein [Chamaesiphon sp. VAR_48_metabat_403]|uniref:CHAT domain-containing protein n=1 Tax=Chamaesiphon sp. VAR_48_metabat_403 TaxID=2964700 RepID=UPI00286E59A8|nr:CHAT domain-containing tetratricopeptide repeat protein [Chamaesiphon sp. VAR_48_metabat_403]
MNIKVGILSVYLLAIGLAPAIATDRVQLSTNLGNKVDRIAQTTASDFFQTGVTHYRDRQLKQAVTAWQQALKLYQKDRDEQGEIATLGVLNSGYLDLGEYTRSTESGERLLQLAKKTNNLKIQAQTLGNLGIAYQRLGNYPKSLTINQQAVTIFKSLNMRQAEGQVLSNLGNTYAIIGDYDRAIPLYKQGLEIARSTKNTQQEGNILSNLGAVYTNQGQDRKALTFYQDSLKIVRTLDDRTLQTGILINLGTTHYLLGDKDLGVTTYQQAQTLAKQLENPQLLGEVLSNLGLIYEDRREYAKAIQSHQQSLDIAIASKNPRTEALARNSLAHTFLATNRLADAQQQLRSAIATLDRMRSSLSELEQVSIFDTQAFSYNLLEQVLIADRKPEAALEAAEQGRARAFALRLANRLTSTASSQPSRESADISTPSIDKIRQIAKQHQATLVSYSIVADQEFKFRGKQRGEAAELYIWVVQPNGKVTFRQVDLKSLRQQKITLEQLTNASRCLMPDRQDCLDIEPSIAKFTKGKYPALRELYQIAIAPIADLLPQNPDDYVIFIPQDSLFRVPFAALQSPDGKFLIEKHTVLSAPSIQVLNFTDRQRQLQSNDTNRSAVVVGNPTMPKIVNKIGEPPFQLAALPGSEQEAKEISQLLNTQPMMGKSATKANFLKTLSQARFVHLATHGLLNYVSIAGVDSTEVPGALALAPAGTDDGLLTSREILNLKLNAKLVVLSACDTGRGRITGDGVIGLSRAWISTGVPSTIVSLRTVPDLSTRTLMVSFYQNFTKTSNIARSLRLAMLETKKTNPIPINWAAFILIGEPESKF